jgi:hypothetical protein
VKFEVGFRGLDRLRALPGKLAETVDEAERKTVLEEGGTITPKSAKVLAVPVGNALTATGRARFASPREVEGGFWLSRPGRPPLFVVERGGSKSRRLDVLFVGLPRVTLEGKRSAAKAAEAAQGQARRVLDEQIRAALAPAGF